MIEKRRWRFCVVDLDDNSTWLDENGDPNGDCHVFVGHSIDAMDEGDRRADLWEEKTGNIVAKVIRDSIGLVSHSKMPISKNP